MLVTCGNLYEPSFHGMVVVEFLLFGGFGVTWKSMTLCPPHVFYYLSKIEWGPTNGPLSKLLELLGTRV